MGLYDLVEASEQLDIVKYLMPDRQPILRVKLDSDKLITHSDPDGSSAMPLSTGQARVLVQEAFKTETINRNIFLPEV